MPVRLRTSGRAHVEMSDLPGRLSRVATGNPLDTTHVRRADRPSLDHMPIVVFLRKGPFDGKVHTVDADELEDSLVIAGRVYERSASTTTVEGEELPVYEFEYEAAN
jgi:hypothetical protein